MFSNAGMHNSEKGVLGLSIYQNVRLRVPWLIFGLIGGLLAVKVIGYFETTLEEQVIIAAFIPLITYMADAVGNQTQIIFIRSLAVNGEISGLRYLSREFIVSFLISLILSITVLISLGLLGQDSNLIKVVAIALFLTVNFASLVGVILPLIFKTLKLDPALASGPFATIIRDLSSLMIYFSVVSIII